MPDLPPLALSILWALWIAQACLSIMAVNKFRRQLAKRPSSDNTNFAPRATVIVPFKGHDEDLSVNIRAFCEQDYPDFRLIFVVESADDPAYPLLLQEIAQHPEVAIELVIAGHTGANTGQKVHNQLAVIDRLLVEDDNRPQYSDAWVFADSDCVVGRGWLGEMVRPLYQVTRTGMTTGYRWLVPVESDAGRVTLPSTLASVMNGSVACLKVLRRFTFAWGGSMAILKDLAVEHNLRGLLEGSLDDDFQFTRLTRNAKLHVQFVREVLVPSKVSFTWASLANFAHRQYLLTRVYAPRLFVVAMATMTLYVAAAATTWAWLVYTLVDPPTDRAWVWPTVVLVLMHLLHQVRAALRDRVIADRFNADTLRQLRRTRCWDRFATTLYMTLHWLLALRAVVGRTMDWRGIRYRLDGPQKITKLDS